MSHFCPRCCLSVVCCYFCENKIVRELVRESDSRFLCRCSGCCHDTGGGCSVCACLCAYVRVRVCADGTEKPRKPGQGQRKVRGQSPPPSQHPVALGAHPAHLSVFSRPPLLPLIRMELIWPYSGFHGWLVSVFFPLKAAGSLEVTDLFPLNQIRSLSWWCL